MPDAEELRAKIEQLTPVGVRFVARFVDSLGNPPAATVGRSWLTVDPEWVEYFGLVISSHHGTTSEPLMTEAFEAGFRNACLAQGWGVSPPGSMTQRFVDVHVTAGDGVTRRLSLKSTAARRLSRTTMHVSKLTEAAWIQDMRSASQRRENTLGLFREYRAAVDAIVMLRAFRGPGSPLPVRYELVELPTAVFESLESAGVADFAADGPTIDCAFRGEPQAARVSLDRSDAKITVKQIKLSVCTVHATWELEPR